MQDLRVVWSEGMFITPQHFQQQDQAVAQEMRQLASYRLDKGDVGFASLYLDESYLNIGKFSIVSAAGVFPDGTVFNVDKQISVDVPPDTVDRRIYLGIALAQHGRQQVGEAGNESNGDTLVPQTGGQSPEAHRYVRNRIQLYDTNDQTNLPVDAELAYPNAQILIEGADLSGFAVLECGRVLEVKGDGQVIVEAKFLPNCLRIAAAKQLQRQCTDLIALAKLRATNNAQRIQAGSGDQTAFSLLTERLELSVLNQWIYALSEILDVKTARPRDLFGVLSRLEGDLASVRGQLAPSFVPYAEQKRTALFEGLFVRLQKRITLSDDASVTRLDWDDSLFEKRRLLQLNLNSQRISDTTRVILAIRSSMNAAELSDIFARSAKVASVSRIVELVLHGLPGIPLEYLRLPPSELRSQSDVAYFRVETNHAFWAEALENESLLSMHVDDRVTLASATLYLLD